MSAPMGLRSPIAHQGRPSVLRSPHLLPVADGWAAYEWPLLKQHLPIGYVPGRYEAPAMSWELQD